MVDLALAESSDLNCKDFTGETNSAEAESTLVVLFIVTAPSEDSTNTNKTK